MSTIRVIYHPDAEGKPVEPPFPATDQHPDAKRYTRGALIIDALGGEPTDAEIEAHLNAPVEVPFTAAEILAVLPQDLKDQLTANREKSR